MKKGFVIALALVLLFTAGCSAKQEQPVQTTVPETTVPATTVPETTVPETTAKAPETEPQTTSPVTTSAPETTAAPTEAAESSSAPDVTTAEPAKKSGCGSSVYAVTVILSLVAGAGLAVCRKERGDR